MLSRATPWTAYYDRVPDKDILLYLKTYGLRLTIHSNPCESKQRRVITAQDGMNKVTVEIQVRWFLALRKLTTAGCYLESVLRKNFAFHIKHKEGVGGITPDPLVLVLTILADSVNAVPTKGL